MFGGSTFEAKKPLPGKLRRLWSPIPLPNQLLQLQFPVRLRVVRLQFFGDLFQFLDEQAVEEFLVAFAGWLFRDRLLPADGPAGGGGGGFGGGGRLKAVRAGQSLNRY